MVSDVTGHHKDRAQMWSNQYLYVCIVIPLTIIIIIISYVIKSNRGLSTHVVFSSQKVGCTAAGSHGFPFLFLVLHKEPGGLDLDLLGTSKAVCRTKHKRTTGEARIWGLVDHGEEKKN